MISDEKRRLFKNKRIKVLKRLNSTGYLYTVFELSVNGDQAKPPCHQKFVL